LLSLMTQDKNYRLVMAGVELIIGTQVYKPLFPLFG
jgi:hypothetical protein